LIAGHGLTVGDMLQLNEDLKKLYVIQFQFTISCVPSQFTMSKIQLNVSLKDTEAVECASDVNDLVSLLHKKYAVSCIATGTITAFSRI